MTLEDANGTGTAPDVDNTTGVLGSQSGRVADGDLVIVVSVSGIPELDSVVNAVVLGG